MDFFEISQSIRKIGRDKYVIGKEALDPLVLVEGKTLKTDKGIFKNITSETSNIELSNIDNLILKTGVFDNLSGFQLSSTNSDFSNSSIGNLYLQTGFFKNLSGDIFQTQTGFSQKFFIEDFDVLKELLNISGNLVLTGHHLHEHIDELSGNLVLTGHHLHEHIDELSGNLVLTGHHLHEHIDELSGNLVLTGQRLYEGIDELSGNLVLTGQHLHEHIDELSGNLVLTGQHLHEHIDELSGNLVLTGQRLYEDIDELSGNLVLTGQHLHEHIDELSGKLFDTGSYLESKIKEIESNSGQKIISGNYAENRFLLEEAFEEDEFGDIVPTNHPFISDPMWILKENGDLELRANVWRYNTGPDAFTKDISF